MEWISLAIGFLSTLIVNGCFFYSINRKMKKVEVRDKEADVMKKQDDEWQELYQEAKDDWKASQARVKELQENYDQLLIENKELELCNKELNWYRCTINNCRNRRPPHYYDQEGNEVEQNHE